MGQGEPPTAGPPLGPGECGLDCEGVRYADAEDINLSLLSSVLVILLPGDPSLLAGFDEPRLGPALCVERLFRRLSRSLMFFLIDCCVFDVVVVVSYLSVE